MCERSVIYNKNGTIIAECHVEYNGTWMGTCVVTADVSSPIPIQFSIGDYIIYRNERFVLYYDPTVVKKATRGTYGEGFKYSGIRFYALSNELTQVRFRDIVLADNHIHYTSLPQFNFYAETVDDLADRLQANTNRWCEENNIPLADYWVFITPNRNRSLARGVTSVQYNAAYGANASFYTEGQKFDVVVDVSDITAWQGMALFKEKFGLNFITRNRMCIVGSAGLPTTHLFKYGKNNGLYEIERTADSEQNIVTKLTAYGAEDNMPIRYYATIEEGLMPNNMAINCLMLPGFPKYSLSQLCRSTYDSVAGKTIIEIRKTPSDEYNVFMEIDGNHIIGFSADKEDPYITSPNMPTLGVKEGTISFVEENDDNGLKKIYPSIEGMTVGDVEGSSSTERLDEIYSCDIIRDNGVFGEGDTEPSDFVITLKNLGFDLADAYEKAGSQMVIAMKDGYCGGREFTVNAISHNANGTWACTVSRVKDDLLDIYFPYSYNASIGEEPVANEPYQIRSGDHFVLTGIYLDDTVYIWAASVRLLRNSIAWLLANDYTRYTYLPKVDEIFMARQHDTAQDTGVVSLHDTIKEGDIMLFEDADLGIDGSVYIDTLKIKENGNNGIPTYEVTLRNDKQVGTLQRIQNQINSLSSFVSSGGGGYTAAQIRGFIQSYGAEYFLSKLAPDTANAVITFLQGLQIGSGDYGIDGNGNANLLSAILRSLTGESYTGPDIVGDKGFRLWQDEDGYGHLDIDYLTARMKAYFAELEIRKVTFTQGDLFFSKAGSRIVRVVPVDIDGNVLTPTEGTLHLFSSNGLYFSANGGWYALGTTDEYSDSELLEQIYAYRCYELSDDGTTATVNLWKIGDMARCQTFNIDEGVYTGVANRYYSRLVIRTGREEMPDVNDGLQYNYIDLYVGNSTMQNRIVVQHIKDEDGHGEHDISAQNSGYMENGQHVFYGYDPTIPTGFLQNDLPQVGDDIAQVGSQYDRDRMNLIQLALSDGGAIRIYSGVNTYDLSEFEEVSISPNGVVVNAAFFRLRSGSGEGEEQGVPVWRGAWTAVASYAKLDYVEHDGSQWIWSEDYIAQGASYEPGVHQGWQLYVSKGDTGDAPKVASIVLDSSSVAVVAQSDGTITMNDISGLPTNMYVEYGGERVPTALMTEVIVGGYRIVGGGQEQVRIGICPDPRNYSINQDDITLAWILASTRIQNKLQFSVTFSHDGTSTTVSSYLPVIKTKEGSNGENALDVVLSPTALTIEETSVTNNTHSYDPSNPSSQVRIIDGGTEGVPEDEDVTLAVSPNNAITATYSGGTLTLSNPDNTSKSAVVTVSVTVNGVIYVRYLNVYINRMGTWKMTVESGVASSLAQQQVWVDGELQTFSTEIRQTAVQLGFIGNDIVFKSNDGTVFMQMIAEDVVIDGQTTRIYKVKSDNLDVSNLEASDINITGRSVFHGFLMREKYTLQPSDWEQDTFGVWHLEKPLNEYGSWVEFPSNCPVNYYSLELPHFPLTSLDTGIYLNGEWIEAEDITDAQWEQYCSYVMQFVGAKLLIENKDTSLVIEANTLLQEYGKTTTVTQDGIQHDVVDPSITKILQSLNSLECKCAEIHSGYYTGMAVYWELSLGGAPSKDNRTL